MLQSVSHVFIKTIQTPNYQQWPINNFVIVANTKHASTYSPVTFRSVHTGIEQPFSLKIYFAVTACMTQGFTFR